MNIFGKWKYIGLGGNKIYGLLVRQVKRITRVFLISAIEREKYDVIKTGMYRYHKSYN